MGGASEFSGVFGFECKSLYRLDAQTLNISAMELARKARVRRVPRLFYEEFF